MNSIKISKHGNNGPKWQEKGCPKKARDHHQHHIKMEGIKDPRFFDDEDHDQYLQLDLKYC